MSYTPKTVEVDPAAMTRAIQSHIAAIVERAGGGLVALDPIAIIPALGRIDYTRACPGEDKWWQPATVTVYGHDRAWLKSLAQVIEGPRRPVMRGLQEG